MTEQTGLKETLEMIDFAEYAATKVIVAAKDGLNVSDLPALMDPAIWAKGKEAVDGMNQIPAELKDLSFEEIGQLAIRGVTLAKNLIEAAKKAPAA